MKLKLTYIATSLSLLWERFWQAFWPLITCIAFFIAAAFFNLHQLLGIWLHSIACLVVLVLVLKTALRGIQNFTPPKHKTILQRIEHASGMQHSPLQTLEDRPAGTQDNTARKLWALHQKAIRNALKKLRIGRPSPRVEKYDPYGLRIIALILLVAAWITAGPESQSRLAEALQPELLSTQLVQKPQLDLWITPPSYTDKAPIFLARSSMEDTPNPTTKHSDIEPVIIPENSVLTAQVNGKKKPAILDLGIDEDIHFEYITDRSFALEHKITQARKIIVKQGRRTLFQRDAQIIKDQPPSIAFAQTPSTAHNGALDISYETADDYGLTKIVLEVALDPEIAERFENPSPQSFTFLEASHAPDQIKETRRHDLTASRWAGMPAILTLEVTDVAGQSARSAPQYIILPERPFKHPVAQQVIAARQELIWGTDKESAKPLAQTLFNLANRPDLYRHDIVTFLALNTAAKRLVFSPSTETYTALVKLLWDTALRIEDGNLAVASRDLQNAIQDMKDALARDDISPEEMQRLMQEFEIALGHYMQALQEQMAQQIQEAQGANEIPPEILNRITSRIDMEKIARRMQELAQGGSKAAMRDMLEQLEKMVGNVDPSGMAEANQRFNEAMQALDKLQEIIFKQQELLDRTNRHADTTPTAKITQAMGKEQYDIRLMLGEMMRKISDIIGSIPDRFGIAEQEMRHAENALNKNDPGTSIPHQQKALEALQQEMQTQISSIAKQMEDMMMAFGGGMRGGGYGEGFDPLGRPMNNADTSDIKIPEKHEMRRVQEILEELRDRSNQWQRPAEEREYIDRLLKRF